MKKKIVLLIIFLILGLFALTGCNEVEGENEKRFVTVSDEGEFDVIYDKETKVMYAMSNSAYNRGTITLLVNPSGGPLLYEK